MFFMSGLSVFDSLAFCLYFLGNTINPGAFPGVAKAVAITLKGTAQAFGAAFPQAKITGLLIGLPKDSRFSIIRDVRNVVGHRISGRRSIRSSGTLHSDGTHTTDWHEETWNLLGAGGKLMFDEKLLQRHLEDITALLASLASAACELAESSQPAKGKP
jgi:hypothetical protein